MRLFGDKSQLEFTVKKIDLENGETVGFLFPEKWSYAAAKLAADKYFHRMDKTNRETDLIEVCMRILEKITDDPDRKSDMMWLMLTQMFAFNSPVYFNIGVPGRRQQSSACFITEINDSLVDGEGSIAEAFVTEMTIFKGGSGSGINKSGLRAKDEPLGNTASKTGGHGSSSGPLSFMIPFDSSAGAIKSGGATRRAAKLVRLDIWHLDFMEFIKIKPKYERIGRKIVEAGILEDPMELQLLLPYQNANLCIGLSAEFFDAVHQNVDWIFHSVLKDKDGTYKTCVPHHAPDVLDEIAEAIWETGEPVLHFDQHINEWNTCPHDGEIKNSNPCSEFLHFPNTSCNLGSHKLTAYLNDDDDKTFHTSAFVDAVHTAYDFMDDLIDISEYPTEKIKMETLAYRNIGMGYTDLGSLLMIWGVPYDSKEGRMIAAAITSLMTASCYCASFHKAGVKGGSYPRFSMGNHYAILNKHVKASQRIYDEMSKDDCRDWHCREQIIALLVDQREAWAQVEENMRLNRKLRNANVTLLAPTGTTRIMLDAFTTGCEPEYALVYRKHLADTDSKMDFVNPYVHKCIEAAGCVSLTQEDITEVGSHLLAHGDLEDFNFGSIAAGQVWHDENIRLIKECLATAAPNAAGRCISPEGHMKMIAMIQPHLSMGISKTVNLPWNTTGADIKRYICYANELGIKSISFFRDGCKSYQQPLEVIRKEVGQVDIIIKEESTSMTERVKPPLVADGKRVKFTIHDGAYGEYVLYVHFVEDENSNLREIFITGPKQGNLSQGLLHVISIQMSYMLQLGIPPSQIVERFKGMSFTPQGMCQSDIPGMTFVSSPVDAIMKAMEYLYCVAPEEADEFEKAVAMTKRTTQEMLKKIKEDLRNGKKVSITTEVTCPKCEFPMVPDGATCWTCKHCGWSSGGCSG